MIDGLFRGSLVPSLGLERGESAVPSRGDPRDRHGAQERLKFSLCWGMVANDLQEFGIVRVARDGPLTNFALGRHEVKNGGEDVWQSQRQHRVRRAYSCRFCNLRKGPQLYWRDWSRWANDWRDCSRRWLPYNARAIENADRSSCR